jgi:hypothetical protein
MVLAKFPKLIKVRQTHFTQPEQVLIYADGQRQMMIDEEGCVSVYGRRLD